MGLSQRVAGWLRQRGHEVTHLGDEGLQRLPNGDIFRKAAAERRILLTFDLDFGEIVASTRGTEPSVVVFRLRNARAERVIARLERVVEESGDALARGAIILVGDARHRVRPLPVGGTRVTPWGSVTEHSPYRGFERFVGIDYSGAKTPTSSLRGLRVFVAKGHCEPEEVLPPSAPAKYWSRRGVAEWLRALLSEPQRTLVGIDHAFSFPLRYFETYELPKDWGAFLADFCLHWPTDQVSVDSVRRGERGRGAQRAGDSHWRRVTEVRCGAKSVFHFDVQGSVAKSTHSGLPSLEALREEHRGDVHFWPFDGWSIPPEKSAVVEVYPRLWKDAFPAQSRSGDQHDAYTVARWMCEAAQNGTLASFLEPELAPPDREVARVEGWILGVR